MAQRLAIVALSAILVVVPSGGCGGSGGTGGTGGSTPKTLAAKGTVALPAKFHIPISELSVCTEIGVYPVSANGSFNAMVSSAGPRVIQLVDTKTNKIVLLGYADAASSGSPFANGQGRISATSTADALLFAGLNGGLLPTADWTKFLDLIHASPQEAQVASVVATSVAADPTAISDGDQAIVNAVKAIQSNYVPPRIDSTEKASWKPSIQRVTVSRKPASDGALINVSPADPQSTLVVAPNPDGDGIVATSNSRRRCQIFVYKVGSGPSIKNITPIDPPQEVAANVEVEPEEEIGTFFISIGKGFLGHFSYIPMPNPPIMLQPDPVQEVAVYDVVATGPGSLDTYQGLELEVSPNSQQERALLDQTWRTAAAEETIKVLVKDIVTPILIEMILGSGDEHEIDVDNPTETAIEDAVESLPDVAADLAKHDIQAAALGFINDFKENLAGIQAKVFAAISRKLVSSGFLTAAEFQDSLIRLEQAASIIEILNWGLVTVDVSRSEYDNTAYHTADLWTANVLHPKVTLSPNPATVNDIQNIAILTAQVQGETDLSNFRFQWSTSGTEGSLEEPHSSIPMPTTPTAFSECAYVANLQKLKNGSSDTVKVTMYAVDDINTPLATATALVKAQPGIEQGSFFIDSTDDFPGIVTNDPWVVSAVVTCPFVKGATSYIVEASGPNTGEYSYFVSTNGGLQVLDGDKKPYKQYVSYAGGVTICIYGMDAVNEAALGLSGAVAYLEKLYPITTVNVTYH